MTTYVPKPFTTGEILEKIQEYLEPETPRDPYFEHKFHLLEITGTGCRCNPQGSSNLILPTWPVHRPGPIIPK